MRIDFETLAFLSKADLEAVLREVDLNTLEEASRTAPAEILDAIFEAADPQVRSALKNYLKDSEPVTLDRIQDAQSVVVKTIEKLIGSGVITLVSQANARPARGIPPAKGDTKEVKSVLDLILARADLYSKLEANRRLADLFSETGGKDYSNIEEFLIFSLEESIGRGQVQALSGLIQRDMEQLSEVVEQYDGVFDYLSSDTKWAQLAIVLETISVLSKFKEGFGGDSKADQVLSALQRQWQR